MKSRVNITAVHLPPWVGTQATRCLNSLPRYPKTLPVLSSMTWRPNSKEQDRLLNSQVCNKSSRAELCIICCKGRLYNLLAYKRFSLCLINFLTCWIMERGTQIVCQYHIKKLGFSPDITDKAQRRYLTVRSETIKFKIHTFKIL